ncbi:flagellar hook-length control protein FliK [Sphingomonas endolithica]|uniref:flagellar hook-length control protein FliK n=1 Tax=Sphingomonas endolithica TaxID=2972485 RepID=UPI0021B02294|nr:flagellar hook-length control protein FliK [Sphingomonas sp. ZFBP2030]
MIALSSSATQLSATTIVAPTGPVPMDGFAVVLAGLTEVDGAAVATMGIVPTPHEALGQPSKAERLPSADDAREAPALNPTLLVAGAYPVANVVPDMSPLPGLPAKRQAIADSGKNVPAEISGRDKPEELIWPLAAAAPLMPMLPVRALPTPQPAKPIEVTLVGSATPPVSGVAPVVESSVPPPTPQQVPPTLARLIVTTPLLTTAAEAAAATTTQLKATSPSQPSGTVATAAMPVRYVASPLSMLAPTPVAASDRSIAIPVTARSSAAAQPLASLAATMTSMPADVIKAAATRQTTADVQTDASAPGHLPPPALSPPSAAMVASAPITADNKVAALRLGPMPQPPFIQPAAQAFAAKITAVGRTNDNLIDASMPQVGVAAPLDAQRAPTIAVAANVDDLRQESGQPGMIAQIATPFPAPAEREADVAVPPRLAAAVPSQAPQPSLIQPAGQAFAAAINAVARTRHDDDRSDGSTPQIGVPAPLDGVRLSAIPVTAEARHGALDLRQESGLQGMIERIEILRDDADARNTRIRLVPDALGAVDVSLRRDGERVHVHFAAENPASARLLHEAQPRLAELADARGIKLGDATVGADRDTRHARQQLQPTAIAPAAPTIDDAVDMITDIRIA